jgi:HlyD family secretion protein
MDRARPKSNSPKIRGAVIIIAVALLIVSGGAKLASIDFASRRVDRNRLSIETVRRGTLEIKVSANGQLLSKTIEQVVAQVPGRVAKADIKPGAVVHMGQALVVLTNPEIVTSEEEAQSAWEGSVAEFKASEAELQNNTLNQEVVVTQAQLSIEKTQLTAETDRALAKEGLISGNEQKQAEFDLVRSIKTHAIEESRLETLRENIQVQLAVRQSRVTQMARALERAKTQAANLKIVAGINGIVQAINVEVGQQVQPGSPIGRLARLDQLFAELKVPAREATQVQVGQKVVVDTRNGTVPGVVSRVDPGVIEGAVVVDVDLRGALPVGARPQLQIEGVIYTSQLANTLYVGKPAYVKNDSEISVYKLDPAGLYAAPVRIKAGKISLDYLQVLQGLQAGDRIITSEVGEWQGQDRILLK